MPLYSYRCSSCGKVFELLHKTAQVASPPCPDCDSSEVVRLPSLPAKPVFSRDAGGSCCGTREGCESPKRCCERRE